MYSSTPPPPKPKNPPFSNSKKPLTAEGKINDTSLIKHLKNLLTN
jgi:hypothetical protein